MTLIELLIVIAIVSILALVLLPAVSSVLYNAKQTKSLGNLRGIGQAAIVYASENGNAFPMLRTGGRAPLWTHQLYPYLPPYAIGSGYWCSPILLDPLVEVHNIDYGDYGANSLVFTEPDALVVAEVVNPSAVAMVMTARNGNRVSYNVFAPGYINNPARVDEMPHARARGKVLAVMVDGHVEAIDERDFINRRVSLLRPQVVQLP